MGPNRFSSCMNWRIISICIGVLTTILWSVAAYYVAWGIFPVSAFEYENGYYAINNSVPVSAFICILTSIGVSALMVFGAIKRNVNYILPWLAIHLVVTICSTATALTNLIFSMFVVNEQKYIMKFMASAIFTSVGLTFLWGSVYLYWKSLVTPTQVQTTLPEEDKFLKTPDIPKTQHV